jgi:integrase
MRNKLTPLRVKSLPKGTHTDGGCLILRVDTSLTRRWFYRYQIHGNRHDLYLGKFPEVSLADAREQRDQQAFLRRQGKDPKQARAASKITASAGMSFGDLTDRAFDATRDSLKGDGIAGRWMSPLTLYALPKIGQMAASDVDQSVVEAVLRPIWKTKHPTAIKLANRIGIVLRHGAALGLPVHIDAVDRAKLILGRQVTVPKSHPAMPWRDLPQFYQSLKDESIPQLALKLTILTLHRLRPVRLARDEEFDGDIWTVPGANMKGGILQTDFRVHITDEMHSVIGAARKLHMRDGYLFPSMTRGGTSPVVSDAAMEKVMRAHDGAWGASYRPHGLRSTFRMWAEEHAVDYAVAETQLAHRDGGSIERVYQRSDLLERRAKTMQKWSDFMMGETSNVVQLIG